jgi:hypothetical protein
MVHIKDIAFMKKFWFYLVVFLGLFIGLKSCIISTISIDKYIVVEKTDETGQHDRVILTPNEEMIYVKRFNDIDEIGIYKIKGIEATHYFLGLYCIGSFPFGLRYYNNVDKVIDSELVLTKKRGNSFPNIGESFKAKILIFNDKVTIGKYSFKRVSLSTTENSELISSIDKLKSAIDL